MSSNRARDNVEDRREATIESDEINLGEYFAILRSHWRRILGISISVGVVVLLFLFLKPNMYKASATITPSKEDNKNVSALGPISSFGLNIRGPTEVEDLEALFKSNDLTVRVFHKYNLWPVVFPTDFDAKEGKLKAGWVARLFGGKGSRVPGDWDAIREAEKRLRVSVNKKMGTLTISFESRSPEGSANIVRQYLEEGKTRLQEEAFGRANKNKKFIEEQIGKTVDTLTRDRLYALFGQEVEKEMLARNREQFGFTIIDSPRMPDRKSGPKRGIITATATVLFSFIYCLLIVHRRDNRPNSG